MFNKYVHIAGNVIVAAIGALLASDLTTILDPKTAGVVITILGVAKTVINAIQGDPAQAPK